MSSIKKPLSVLPFCAITFSDINTLCKHEKFLQTLFSEIKGKSEIINFSELTDYYNAEMGDKLYKIFYFFKNILLPDDFHLNKIQTNNYEIKCGWEKTANIISRTVNIDPGYITEAKLILFSAKDFSHRVYIGDGIYGEVQLTFKKNSFSGLFWSYSDYLKPEIIDFLNEARNYLRNNLGRK